MLFKMDSILNSHAMEQFKRSYEHSTCFRHVGVARSAGSAAILANPQVDACWYSDKV